MIVLACGDRNWKDRRKLWAVLTRLRGVKLLIEGGARGADKLAYEWAQLSGIQTVTLDANWAHFGVAAGPIRNEKMLQVLRELPDERKLVVAFHADLKKSKGTRHMVTLARQAKVPVRVVR